MFRVWPFDQDVNASVLRAFELWNTYGNGTWNEVNRMADSSCFALGTPRGILVTFDLRGK